MLVKVFAAVVAIALVAVGMSDYRDRQRIDALELAVSRLEGRQGSDGAKRSAVTTISLERSLSLADSPSLGSSSAQVALVVYSDFQCAYCSSFARATQPAILDRYVRSNKVRLVFKHLPLDGIHSRARALAETAACAHQQGRFWPFHDAFLSDRNSWGEMEIQSRVSLLAMDRPRFERCVAERETRGLVDEQVAEAQEAGISGTPGFLLGRTDGHTMVVTNRIAGAQPLSAFAEVIDSLLKR